MGNLRSKSKRLFSSQEVAGTATATIDIGQYRYASIQVNITEACLTASSVPDECINLNTDKLSESSHGYATGLKGTLTASTGCAKATPAACFNTCCNIITEACHGFTTGERGRFTTSGTFPDFCCATICACTDYYVISLSCCTYNVATSRANAIAGTGVCITSAGVGNHTFTPNGDVPTGVCACGTYYIINVDDNSYKLASSKANAIAGTAINLTALNAPAATVFTPACGDATSGTVTVRYSNCTTKCATYLADTGIGLLSTPGVINACSCGLSVIDAETGVIPYQSIQVEVDVTDSQWISTIDVHIKE